MGLRSFEAASSSRRWKKTGSIANANTAILAAATPAARRAAFFARNNPWVSRAVSSLVSNVIGTGITPRSQHPDPKVREALRRLWGAWARHTGYYEKQALAVRMMIESGEAFAVLRATDPSRPGLVPLALDLVDREQVPLDHTMEFGGGSRVRAGIERDAHGEIVAYHMLPARPDEAFIVPLGYRPIRVPAADVLHLFQPIGAGQLRGMSWLAPVLSRLNELDQYEDAGLVRAKVQALFTGFIVDLEGERKDGGEGDEDEVMEPGALVRLPIGSDVRFGEPKGEKEYTPFVKAHLRGVAAGVGPGVPYELVSGDLEGVTYSSIRTGLIEYRRSLEQLQDLTIIPRLCSPVWERFVTLAVLSGLLDAPDFGANPESYFAVEWQPPGWEWVDPEADVNAAVTAIGARLTSRARVIAQRGYDVEDVDREIAAGSVAVAATPSEAPAAVGRAKLRPRRKPS